MFVVGMMRSTVGRASNNCGGVDELQHCAGMRVCAASECLSLKKYIRCQKAFNAACCYKSINSQVCSLSPQKRDNQPPTLCCFPLVKAKNVCRNCKSRLAFTFCVINLLDSLETLGMMATTSLEPGALSAKKQLHVFFTL